MTKYKYFILSEFIIKIYFVTFLDSVLSIFLPPKLTQQPRDQLIVSDTISRDPTNGSDLSETRRGGHPIHLAPKVEVLYDFTNNNIIDMNKKL